MKLQDAQLYLINLHSQSWLYHLEDDAADCLRNVATESQALDVQKNVNEIMESNFDWGIFNSPMGFCLALVNNDIDKFKNHGINIKGAISNEE